MADTPKRKTTKPAINLDADPHNANWLRHPGGAIPPKPTPHAPSSSTSSGDQRDT